ncbi:MAG: hypothetical protein LBD04_02405, partial [Synergistaceae bacterium]|nr:hypothetical protein [Synergistaceae bacterium]
PSGYKAIFINAVFQSKLYQDSMVMIDTLIGQSFTRQGILRTPNIIYLFGPLGYKAIFKMRYFKVNFIMISWL